MNNICKNLNIISKKKFRKTGLALAVVVVGCSSFSAIADEYSGWYLGGNIGQSRSHLDDEKTTEDLFGPGYTVGAINDDKNDTGYKLYGGYQFNKYFSLEAGYFDLGETRFLADMSAPPGTFGGTTSVTGFNLDLVGYLHFTPKFSGFGRLGLNHAKPEEKFTGTGSYAPVTYDSSEWDTNAKFGVGLQYDFTPHWSGRLEAERYRVQDGVANRNFIDLVSLGVVYHFGKKEVAAPVKPQPIVAAPKPMQEYCTSLEIEFEIDQDKIQRADREKLSAVAAFMNKYPSVTGTIEGRTDDVDTNQYNQALSERRANNVVRYLEDNLHVANSRLKAVGYGETSPKAENTTQEGKRANRHVNGVISCATDVQGLTQFTARVSTSEVIHFDRNKTAVDQKYNEELNKVAAFLKEHPTITATVEGHTDDSSPATAKKVSQDRAQNVVNYLISQGVPAAQLSAEGFGGTRRVAYNDTAEGRQENRRANIVLNYPDAPQ